MTASVRPVVGLTGATEWFWTVIRDGRLYATGIEATEAEAIAAAHAADAT